jgi:hypothetical protein
MKRNPAKHRVQFNIAMRGEGWSVFDMDSGNVVDHFLARHSAIARMKQLNAAGRW